MDFSEVCVSLKAKLDRKVDDNYGLLNAPVFVAICIIAPLADRAVHPVDTSRWLYGGFKRWIRADLPE